MKLLFFFLPLWKHVFLGHPYFKCYTKEKKHEKVNFFCYENFYYYFFKVNLAKYKIKMKLVEKPYW